MAKKTYRTANGKKVDMAALQLQNETVRAVGNMGVNARGDIINGKNEIVAGRNSQVAKTYKKQIVSNVTDEPVYEKRQDID
jgi:hypothetical protein